MKTIDEEAKYYAVGLEVSEYEQLSKDQMELHAKLDFKAGVVFVQRWIPVEEELPENVLEVKINPLGTMFTTDQVLVRTKTDGIKLKKRVRLKGKWHWAVGCDVIEWRPIEFK